MDPELELAVNHPSKRLFFKLHCSGFVDVNPVLRTGASAKPDVASADWYQIE